MRSWGGADPLQVQRAALRLRELEGPRSGCPGEEAQESEALRLEEAGALKLRLGIWMGSARGRRRLRGCYLTDFAR